ncbi:MAG: lytic transglycosylase domain-containing protein [Chloroflexi bacterium]|nr:lytic transglycosylase domain-containing protein [Chloroflexota bacterium]
MNVPPTAHHSAVQAALDRAKRLGFDLTAPVRQRASRAAQSNGALHLPDGDRTAGVAAAASGNRFEALILEAAAREGVDPALAGAVARAESNLNPRAVSSAGAKGLMQLMDGTARALGVADSFDPVQNAIGGVKYLKQMLTRYGGDVARALAAYNAGPGAVDKHGGVPPFKETQHYVQRVLALRDQNR